MVSVNMVGLNTALNTLKLLKASSPQSKPPLPEAPSIIVGDRTGLTTVSGLVAKLLDLSASANLTAERTKAASTSDFSEAQIAKFRAMGADAWVRKPVEGTEEENRQLAWKMLTENAGKDGAYSEAIKNGTLRLVPASDVPEFGYRLHSVDLFKDGHLMGGTSWSEANINYINEQRQKGIYVSAISVNGSDFVTMWPAPKS
ncbi:MAG: hypothetical protein ACFCUR_04725 [Rhodomicrobiaceae bacterium]